MRRSPSRTRRAKRCSSAATSIWSNARRLSADETTIFRHRRHSCRCGGSDLYGRRQPQPQGASLGAITERRTGIAWHLTRTPRPHPRNMSCRRSKRGSTCWSCFRSDRIRCRRPRSHAALGRNVSEIFRTLSALEGRGYIRRTQAGQYRLTLKLFELSRTHSPYEELLRVALPIMRDLSEEVCETLPSHDPARRIDHRAGSA